MSGTDKTIEILIETERLADQILQNKQELVLLQQRTEDTRVALRELTKSDDTKTWLTVGSLLIKASKEEALQLLNKGKCLFLFNNLFVLNLKLVLICL